MVSPTEQQREDRLTIARLEARVAELEEALTRRSRELRALQRHLCPADLAILVRVTNGLEAVPAETFEPDLWEESVALRSADVEDTLTRLWSSLAPVGEAGASRAPGASTSRRSASSPAERCGGSSNDD